MRKIFSILLTFVLLISAEAAFGASDNILSGNIKEADGTTDQDTNIGSGVKTGHIQDGAITTSKVADGSITSSKIADGNVTTSKIVDGSVTDSKIAGPISASKISSTGLNADTVDGMHAAEFATSVHTHTQSQVIGLESALAGKADATHNHDARYQQKYAKVAVVAQTGGDYTDPVVAMNDIVTWCGCPSATNPCLLKIMPGVYDIGANHIDIPSFVAVEGAGEVNTIVAGTPLGESGSFDAVMNANDNTEIRRLTVKHLGSSSKALGIKISGSATINHVTVNASGGGQGTWGIFITAGRSSISDATIIIGSSNGGGGVDLVSFNGPAVVADLNDVSISGNSGAITGVYLQEAQDVVMMNHVSINTDSRGVESYGTLAIRNSTITSSIAVFTYGPATVTGSNLTGFNGAVIAENTSANLSLNQIYGAVTGDGNSTIRCFNNYDTNLSLMTCP